jgi:hypothetical protein
LLKTYLLSAGHGEKQLRRVGHNLERALKEGRALGLDRLVRVSPQVERDLVEFSGVYAMEAFRYFSILYLLSPPQLPDLRRLVRFAQTLSRQLASHLRAA